MGPDMTEWLKEKYEAILSFPKDISPEQSNLL